MQLLLLTNQCPKSFHLRRTNCRIQSYQLYAVEKWILQRRHTTLLVVYTGNPEHTITLDAYEPDSQDVWDSTIAVLRADGARPRQTTEGVLMVTSLAHFRSDYTIVQIPGGDFNQVKDQLYANINLLRIGCSGRTALTLEDPSESTKERFISLYSLPDPAPPTSVDHLPLQAQSRPSLSFNNSTSSLPSSRKDARSRECFVTTVLELIKLVQAGLALFGMPNMTTVPHNLTFDGLLCDDTVQGIHLWTSHTGGPCVGLEPTQRTPDPLFVSALLSLVLSIRNKLAYLGYSHLLPRDPFLYPYAFSLAISSFIHSSSNSSVSGPASHHQTFSSPSAGHAVHIPSLIPAAPPPTNFFSVAAAASAAAAVISSPTAVAAIANSSTFPTGAILTRDLVQNITSAYDSKLKAENRKVRRVIKNKLVVGVDSDGDNTSNIGGIEQQRRQHALSLSTLSGGEGPPSLMINSDRSPSNSQAGGSNAPVGTAGNASGTAGSSSGGQILSGIASGLGLSASGEPSIVPTVDLSAFVASVLRSNGAGGSGGGGGGSHNPISSRRERKKREKDRNSLSLRAGESVDFGIAGATASGGSSVGGGGTSLGFYYERDKDKDGGAVGGTVRALWSGRIVDLVKMREEAEGIATSGASLRSVSSSLPAGLRPPNALHKRSRSSDATKWSKQQKQLQKQADMNRRQHPAGVASDGDDSSKDRNRYDGRSTEEESDVFLTPASASNTFGGMWSGRVKGRLGNWAGLGKRKNQSVDLGSSSVMSTPPAKGKERERERDTTDKEKDSDRGHSTSKNLSVPQAQSQSQSRGPSPSASPSQLTKLVISGSPATPVNRRPSISRRSTASGAQSPTLPPHDVYSDDDLLSSGQVSPLSDYRPNPFNMLGNNNVDNNTKTTLSVGADGSSINLSSGVGSLGPPINLQEYERTLEKLVRQKKLPSWAARKPLQHNQVRVASWADPVSAKDEEDVEVDEDETIEEVEDGEDASVEATVAGKRRSRMRDRESGGDDSDFRPGNASAKGKGRARDKAAAGGADAIYRSKRKEKARFHSLLSVMDGEGVLVEEPLEIEEEDDYEEGGYENEDELGMESEDNELGLDSLSRAGERRRKKRGVYGFDVQRRRSMHDLDSFRGIEVLSPERMKIDVDICGHLLIMYRREEHIRNVIAATRLIANSIAQTNAALREHYTTHLDTLHQIDKSTSVLAEIDAARLRSLKYLQSTNTLQYESAQFQVDEDLWQTVRPARHKVFELREKVFGTSNASGTGAGTGAGASGGRRLAPGVHGAHGAFNRLQWTLDGKPRLVDHLGRTESEAEEERMFDERSAGVFRDGQPPTPASAGGELPSLAEEEEGDVVEHPGIKPMWLLRFFTSWGARWSAAAAAAPATGSGGTSGVTSASPGEAETSSKATSPSPEEKRDGLHSQSSPTLPNAHSKPSTTKELKEKPRSASH
ncbi:hypothetical protein CPC08DRAFT_703209 [Agrocybe pediades]|nr:hypothetical protein CPC08DRAFT_703209 [Agrocybe pediades]